MSESIIEDPTRLVNQFFPVFRPGEVITYQDFMQRMDANGGFGVRTLARWKAAGFKVYQPATKGGWVFTDDVIAMIRRGDDFPPYSPEYKQRE